MLLVSELPLFTEMPSRGLLGNSPKKPPQIVCKGDTQRLLKRHHVSSRKASLPGKQGKESLHMSTEPGGINGTAMQGPACVYVN